MCMLRTGEGKQYILLNSSDARHDIPQGYHIAHGYAADVCKSAIAQLGVHCSCTVHSWNARLALLSEKGAA